MKLYHGTSTRYLDKILAAGGIKKTDAERLEWAQPGKVTVL